MKTRKSLIEIICFLLMLNFFYEGIYKIAYIDEYGFWVTHAPLLNSILGKVLKYLVPTLEIALSILLLFSSKRQFALSSIIIAEILFVGWVMSAFLFTSYLFWPWRALWAKPNWLQKMSYGLLLAWLAFLAIVLSGNQVLFKKMKQKLVNN